MSTLRISTFPGSTNTPLSLALDRGWFEEVRLKPDVTEVTSSQEQMAAWEGGEIDVMHTSPDHLFRKRRSHDPVIVRRDGFGEIGVFVTGRDPRALSWAVDDPDSGFALVLRFLVARRYGIEIPGERMIAIGGTRERFQALIDGDPRVQGTALHPPFDQLASEAGLQRIAGHLKELPRLATLVTIVQRPALNCDKIKTYLRIIDRAVATLAAGGEAEIFSTLIDHGMPDRFARASAKGLSGPAGFAIERTPDIDELNAVAELRRQVDPDWLQPVRVDQLLP